MSDQTTRRGRDNPLVAPGRSAAVTPGPQGPLPPSGAAIGLGGGRPPPRLLDRAREAIRTRHYSPRTEKADVGWIKRHIWPIPFRRYPDRHGLDNTKAGPRASARKPVGDETLPHT